MFDAIDGAFDTMIRPLTKLWCRVTGKRNTTFAICLNLFGGALLVVGAIIAAFMDSEDLWDYTLVFLAMAIWPVLVVMRHKLYKNLDRALENVSPDGVLDVDVTSLMGTVITRWMFIVWGVFLIWLNIFSPVVSSIFTTTGFLFYAISAYVIFHLQIPKSSLWSRTKTRLKNGVDRVASILTPSPAPIPIPVQG